MTRRFQDMTICPKCGHVHDTETPFNRWMRGCEELDSVRHGIVRFDNDLLLHRYMFKTDGLGSRRVQAIMLVEVKTFGAVLKASQHDTLSIFSQVLRNRRRNRHRCARGRHAADHTPPAKVVSITQRRPVQLRMFGAHLLRLSADAPNTSEWIEWDHKRIETPTLIKLLRFDLDPDTLKPMDWRRRYRAAGEPLDLFHPDTDGAA